MLLDKLSGRPAALALAKVDMREVESALDLGYVFVFGSETRWDEFAVVQSTSRDAFGGCLCSVIV